MTYRYRHPSNRRLALVGLGLFLALCLLPAARADASYEQVATFDQSPHLLHSGGTAVNYTGAGGVPVGTVYAVIEANTEFPASVIRYSPQGEFRAAWGYGVGNRALNEYQRCGPDGDPLYPTCAKGSGGSGEGLGQLSRPVGVAVNQTTGDVYVLNIERQHDSVQVFSADGSKRLGGFGELGKPAKFPEPAESIEEGPGKFHLLAKSLGSGIAVDGSGRVYVTDSDFAEATPPHHARVMIFDPESPGDYEHYVYTGRDDDINAPYEYADYIAAVDASGDIYGASDSVVHEYAAGDHHLLCQLELPSGGLQGMTVNPTNGDVFYFTTKKGGSLRRLRCNGAGEFEEVEEFAPSPKVAHLQALSFSPNLVYSGERPAGAIYAVEPEVEEPKTNTVIGRGYIFAQSEVHAPEVDSPAALEITPSSAVLHANVNPKGAQTNYVFQYISEAAYEANGPGERFAGASEAPPGGAVLAPGLKPVAVAAVVQGLTPDAPYRYRVVANSCVEGEDPESCTAEGEAEAFRTFPVEPAGPPDHRAFELVSPAQKSGGEVFPARSFVFTPSCLECRPGAYSVRFPKLSSPDGERVVYDGDPFSSTEGNKYTNEYFSQRTPSGWQTKTLTPVLMSGGGEAGHRGFSRDLGRAAFMQGQPALLPSAPAETPNVYTQSTSSPGSIANLIGEEAPNEGKELDVTYAGASTDLGHVFFSADDALTGETPFAPEASYEFRKDNLYESFEGQLRLVNVLPGNAGSALGASFGVPAGGNEAADLSHAISDDGSRAFWSDASGQVYVREDGESTRKIPEPGKFLTASADGSKVLLRGGELYDLESETTTDLTEGKGGFQGIAGQSEDLSRIYFVDSAVLDETPNSNGDSAKAGKNNLYSWHEGVASFVASLGGSDGDWAASPANRGAEASPDGRWLAFRSTASLTGFDNVGVCKYEPIAAGHPKPSFGSDSCAEAFLYDAESGELRCPSCASSGEAPRGHTSLPQLEKVEGSAPQVGYLNDEGRLYFDTANRLSPQDSNGVIEDVYEFEPEGVGTCERPEGCVVLVSSGHGSTDANLAAVDETGKNVFFTSRDQLALKDKDTLIDLYDAREGGGIASESESLRSECQGEACQPAVIDPNDPTPSSASFSGKGNVSPEASKRCPKGKRKVSTRGKVRCVARKPQRHRKAAHHKRANRNHGGAK